MNKETEEKISQLAFFEQGMQSLLSQKYSIQNELLEIESAFDELTTSSISYKILGNIMVKVDSSKLKEELLERKEIILTKIKNIESQEKKLQEKAQKLQSEVMKELEEEG